jgi:predicted RNA binding protein YcfA (HicA-like mRNA interferase family)
MPKIPGINHLQAIRALERAGLRIIRQGRKHVVMTNGERFLTIPRNNPINSYTMGGIVKDAV